jgi:hypothetical protein
MAEFVAVFLLYTFKADWYWWFLFIAIVGLEVWSEYRKIMRTLKLQKTAKQPE